MSTDARVQRALQYSATEVPVDHLRVSQMMAEIITLRGHVGALLRVIGEQGGMGETSQAGAAQPGGAL